MDDLGHFLNGRFYLVKGLAMIRKIEAESMILFRKRFGNGTPVSGRPEQSMKKNNGRILGVPPFFDIKVGYHLK
jgi:hypothetical protein